MFAERNSGPVEATPPLPDCNQSSAYYMTKQMEGDEHEFRAVNNPSVKYENISVFNKM
jgi:hypothetical protein